MAAFEVITNLGYCLMGNHVHLIAVPEAESSLARRVGTDALRIRSFSRTKCVCPLFPRAGGHLASRDWALRNATALWDAIPAEDAAALRRLPPQHQAAKGKELFRLAREHLARRVTEKMAGGRFELTAPPDEGLSQFTIRYRPAMLIDATWQRFAEEIAGMIACARCPAPKCGRWFLRSAGRSDRQYCSHACQMRQLRGAPGGA